MAGETTVTVIGNLTADPELRYTSSGIPVCSFRVASTPRIRNRQTGEWEDGNPLFLGCEVWREAAENAGESLKKGMRVIVQGNLNQRSYQTQSGEQRTVFELKNCEVGPSLFRARAQVTRNERGGSSYAGAVVPGIMVLGVGIGFVMPVTFNSGTRGAPVSHIGLASAVITVSQQIGASLSAAMLAH